MLHASQCLQDDFGIQVRLCLPADGLGNVEGWARHGARWVLESQRESWAWVNMCLPACRL